MERRHFLTLGLSAIAGSLGAGCEKSARAGLVCNDTSDLSPADVTARAAVRYVDRATEPVRSCESCVQFVAASSSNACAACKVMKGPVHPDGSCSVYAKRA